MHKKSLQRGNTHFFPKAQKVGKKPQETNGLICFKGDFEEVVEGKGF